MANINKTKDIQFWGGSGHLHNVESNANWGSHTGYQFGYLLKVKAMFQTGCSWSEAPCLHMTVIPSGGGGLQGSYLIAASLFG